MTNTFVLYQKLNVMMNIVKNVQVVLKCVIHVLKDMNSMLNIFVNKLLLVVMMSTVLLVLLVLICVIHVMKDLSSMVCFVLMLNL